MKRHPGDTLSSAQGAALERDLGFVGKEVSPSHRSRGAALGPGQQEKKAVP